MLNIIKKSFSITKNNPTLVLFFVVYLILLSVFLQIFSNIQNGILFGLSFIMIILFNAAFFSGWFGMIKKAIKNANKKYINPDDKYEDILNLRKDFFGAIPIYILPVLAVFGLYYLCFLFLIYTGVMFATKFIGSIDFLLENVKSISGSSEMTLQYLQSLPLEQLRIIYFWQAFFVVLIAIFGIFTLFLPAALYFEKNNRKNPLKAFIDSAATLIKRPLGVLGFDIVIGILFFAMMILQYICAINTILYFAYLIVAIYATVFMVVLLFNYYDKRFAGNNCNNGSDSLGENKNCNSTCEKN